MGREKQSRMVRQQWRREMEKPRAAIPDDSLG